MPEKNSQESVDVELMRTELRSVIEHAQTALDVLDRVSEDAIRPERGPEANVLYGPLRSALSSLTNAARAALPDSEYDGRALWLIANLWDAAWGQYDKSFIAHCWEVHRGLPDKEHDVLLRNRLFHYCSLIARSKSPPRSSEEEVENVLSLFSNDATLALLDRAKAARTEIGTLVGAIRSGKGKRDEVTVDAAASGLFAAIGLPPQSIESFRRGYRRKQPK
ncbi:MAG TPA: hypothetical protein VIV60_12685 [Polyangiaceae bacterium]